MSREVIVLGAGNAALVSALAAHEGGAKVIVIERAPRDRRGGNTYFTSAAFRFGATSVDAIREIVPDVEADVATALADRLYTPEQFALDLMRASANLAQPELVRLLADRSASTLAWMRRQGVIFRMPWHDLPPGTTGAQRWGLLPVVEVAGEGAALSNMLFSLVERAGIEIRYGTGAERLVLDRKGELEGVVVKDERGLHDIPTRALVLACGGFGANPELRARYLGPEWATMKVRGSEFSMGTGLMMALAVGAQPAGNWSGAHATPIDAAAKDSPWGDGEMSRRARYPYGIMVNSQARRFVDEGEDIAWFTYARFGLKIQQQPGMIAFQIFDGKPATIPFDSRQYKAAKPVVANSLVELADKLGLDRTALLEEVERYNNAVDDKTPFNPSVKDGKRTTGITPPKSNWARRIDTAPFEAHRVTGGITFTYGGLKIETDCNVLDLSNRRIPGLFAAGETTGGFFAINYPAASGLTRGAVTGLLAGQGAAARVASA